MAMGYETPWTASSGAYNESYAIHTRCRSPHGVPMSAATRRPITLPRISPARLPTASQLICLRVFARLCRQVSRTSAPTLPEISAAMGLSTNGCQTHMRILEEKGLVTQCTLVRVKGVVVKHQRVTAAGERWL